VEPSVTVSRNQGAKIPDGRLTERATGFYRAEEWGREGYPIDRQKKEEEKTEQ